jgi:hypothetical protein
MYVIAFPLLLIPFALYNMIAFLLNMPFTDTMFSIPLMDGRRLPVTTGDLLLAIALLAVLSFVDLIIGLSVRGRRKQPEIMLEDHDRDRF